jgi:hypothetical protein
MQMLPMPLSGFRWLTEPEIYQLWLDIHTWTEDQLVGYILEVDLVLDPSMEDKFASMPMAPQSFDINQDMLSPYAKKCREMIHRSEKYSATKLVATYGTRKKYVVSKSKAKKKSHIILIFLFAMLQLHYMTLLCYLRNGMKLKQIHKVMAFKQTRFLAPYIDKNAQLRKEATSSFVRNLYKLMTNAV